jgi:DnaK suppressor protein
MPLLPHLSQAQRVALADLLQSALDALERERTSQLLGLSQADSARQTLLQDADDGRQRAGEHEVEGSVLDLDSREFEAIRSALQRIHGDGYGLCNDCQAAIPFERLRVEPQALRCADCQARHERQLAA